MAHMAMPSFPTPTQGDRNPSIGTVLGCFKVPLLLFPAVLGLARVFPPSSLRPRRTTKWLLSRVEFFFLPGRRRPPRLKMRSSIALFPLYTMLGGGCSYRLCLGHVFRSAEQGLGPPQVVSKATMYPYPVCASFPFCEVWVGNQVLAPLDPCHCYRRPKRRAPVGPRSFPMIVGAFSSFVFVGWCMLSRRYKPFPPFFKRVWTREYEDPSLHLLRYLLLSLGID